MGQLESGRSWRILTEEARTVQREPFVYRLSRGLEIDPGTYLIAHNLRHPIAGSNSTKIPDFAPRSAAGIAADTMLRSGPTVLWPGCPTGVWSSFSPEQFLKILWLLT